MSAKSLANRVHALRMCSPSVEDAHLVLCPWTAAHWHELFILHKAGCNFGRWKIFNNPSLLLSLIRAGFCSAISVSSPYITLKRNTFFSISSEPAQFSSKPQTPPWSEASFVVSETLTCKRTFLPEIDPQHLYGCCFPSLCFLLHSPSSPLLSLWHFSSAPLWSQSLA